jgi:hypothetical protein
MQYTDITKYFGFELSDLLFHEFLKSISCDPLTYNVSKSPYISSQIAGLEIGFRNDNAVFDEDKEVVFEKGNPIFSLFNIYPSASRFVQTLPFDINFLDTRNKVREKAGPPIKIVDFDDRFLKKRFLIDHFKLDGLAISVDYNLQGETIEVVQIRDKEQAEEHVKL